MAINDKFEGVDGATESDEENTAAVQQLGLLMAMHRSRDGGQASCPVSQRLRRHLVGDSESVAQARSDYKEPTLTAKFNESMLPHIQSSFS